MKIENEQNYERSTRYGSEWDTPGARAFSLDNFLSNDGVHEALQVRERECVYVCVRERKKFCGRVCVCVWV